MVAATVCAVVAGHRSYTAIAEWIADALAQTVAAWCGRGRDTLLRRAVARRPFALLGALLGVSGR